MKLYKATVEAETLNMTLGLIIKPGDIIGVDYENKKVINKTSGEVSKLARLDMVFEGKYNKEKKKYENTLKERLESGNDGNFIPYTEKAEKKSNKRKGV